LKGHHGEVLGRGRREREMLKVKRYAGSRWGTSEESKAKRRERKSPHNSKLCKIIEIINRNTCLKEVRGCNGDDCGQGGERL